MVTPNYRSKDATELLNYAEHIFKKMTENASMFTDPVPSLSIFESKLTDYRAAYAEATNLDKRAVVIKGQKGKELQSAVYRLSHYVDAIALGDPNIILAAGYRPSKSTQTRVGGTPQATGVQVKNVQVGSGILRIQVAPWKHARVYQYDYRKVGTDEWSSVLNSKSAIELDGLEMMERYEFRVSYIGTEARPNFSEIVIGLVV